MRIVVILLFTSFIFSNAEKQITVRNVKNFFSICQGIAAKVKKDANEKDLMIWLIDATPGLEEEIEQLKSEINYFYDSGIKDLSMAVAVIKKETQFSLDITNSPDKIIRFLSTLQYAKGVNAYKNRLLPLRRIAQKYATFPGKKSICYVTLSPWENEDNLEETLTTLKQNNYNLYVVSLEAVFSDYYAIQKKLKNPQFQFRGPETPVDESMWSWITLPSGFYINGQKHNTFFPSGFGFYGLSRLVSQLDGWYYIYTPTLDASASSTSGKTSPGYRYYNLRHYRPKWQARSDYKLELRKNIAKLTYKYWNELASRNGISNYSSPYKVSFQISENNNRNAKVTQLTYTFKSLAQIKSSIKAVSAKINLLRNIKKKIEYATKKIDDQRSRECANLNLLYCNLLKSEFHLQQYFKVILEVNNIQKQLRRHFRNKKQVTITVKNIGSFSRGFSNKEKMSNVEQRIMDKTMETLNKYRALYKGTPWGYNIETGSILTFEYKIVSQPKPAKKPKPKPKPKTKPKKQPQEPVPPTRIMTNSAEGNLQASGN